MTSPLLEAALDNAHLGFRVMPLRARGKRPMWKAWPARATTNRDVICDTWRRTPDANVGVACGYGLVVVDLDGPEGEEAAGDLKLPETASLRTARGRHLYFEGDGPTGASILAGIDIRGRGGLVVGAGSIHESGHHYAWETPPWEMPVAPLPGNLVEQVHKLTDTGQRVLDGSIPEGRRNATLFRCAAGVRGRFGLGSEAILAILRSENCRCRPPLPARELEEIATSAAKFRPPLWATDALAFSDDPSLSAHARHLLLALCGYARHDGVCWPGVRTLSARTGMAKDTIQKAIRQLEAARRISVDRSSRPSHYTLLPYTPPALNATTGSSLLPSRTPGGWAA